jgi:hypothetical protein
MACAVLDDHDVYGSADGEHARLHAAQRVDELLVAGDSEGRGVWLKLSRGC